MESMMQIVLLFAREWNITPFDVLQQDIDDFILLANYLITTGKNTENQEQEPVKINDGFWDF